MIFALLLHLLEDNFPPFPTRPTKIWTRSQLRLIARARNPTPAANTPGQWVQTLPIEYTKEFLSRKTLTVGTGTFYKLYGQLRFSSVLNFSDYDVFLQDLNLCKFLRTRVEFCKKSALKKKINKIYLQGWLGDQARTRLQCWHQGGGQSVSVHLSLSVCLSSSWGFIASGCG